MTIKKIFSVLLLAAIIFVPFTTNAQVTIGSGRAPSEWSLLDLCTDYQRKALHNARMETDDRDALMHPDHPCDDSRRDARGLMIFNIEDDCLEFWNGTQWVSLCVGDEPDPCEGLANIKARFCAGSGATIRQLNEKARAAGGRGTIVWYDIAGNRVDLDHVLVGSRYYADNCVGAIARTPVPISFINCGAMSRDNSRIAAFTNVMYDFQTQALEAFTTQGGEATSWRWQMRVRVGAPVGFAIGGTGYAGSIITIPGGLWLTDDWVDIDLPSATSESLIIPPYFMYTHAGIPVGSNPPVNPNLSEIRISGHRTNTVEISFRCIMTNPTNTITSHELRMLFIRTNTTGFGIDPDTDTRYLTIQRGLNGMTRGGSIQIALLNEGAGDNIDADGLGNFYQWGRRADGHERTHWRRNTTVARNMLEYRRPFVGTVGNWGNTSEPVGRILQQMDFDFETGQVTSDGFVGRFIYRSIWDPTGGNDWGPSPIHTWLSNFHYRGDLWGNSNATRAGAPTTLADWTDRARDNNPCPDGWRVPSRWDAWDMHMGNGNSTAIPVFGTSTPFDNNNNAMNNHWLARPGQLNTAALGGALIRRRDTYETVFLPGVGSRSGQASHTAIGGVSESANVVLLPTSSSRPNVDLHAPYGISVSTAGYAVGWATMERTCGLPVRCVR